MQDIFSKLNDEQKQSVSAVYGPVLVLAGAGSGKTRVLTHRIANLVVNHNVNPANILAITFTNKAAGEMKDRLSRMYLDTDKMWVCTIHGMCNRMLRMFIDTLGFSKSFSIYDDRDKERVLKRLLADRNVDADAELIKSIKFHISNAKNNFMTANQYMENEYIEERNADLIASMLASYDNELKKCNALDFDDLIFKTYEMLNKSSEALDYFQSRFKFVHIDEFQDTNVGQYLLIKLLAAKHGNIFAVGDDDQSIYGWRGAEVENIFKFQKDFKNTQIFKLQRNYRSTKKILELANFIIKNNTSRMEKQLWTDNSDGVRVEKYIGSDEANEAYYVASMIRSLNSYSGCSYKDMAVLVRLNALSNAFEQEFVKYGIPYKIIGGLKFYDRKEIKDIVAYLRLIVNPFDEESLLRIINFPKRGIGDSAINQLRNYADENNLKLLDVIINIDKINAFSTALTRRVSAFKQVVVELMQSSELDTKTDFIKNLVIISGINTAFAENNDENINRRLNIDEFIKVFIDYFEKNQESELDDFLASVSLSADNDDSKDEEDKVTIATIHGVKGLEFRTVFISGLDDGIFPMTRAYNDTKEMEEERRLMYVAITRAMQRLYLTRARSRFLYGSRKYTMESAFLKELSPFFEDKEKKVHNYEEGLIKSDYRSYKGESGFSQENYSDRGNDKYNPSSFIEKKPSFAARQSAAKSFPEKDYNAFVVGAKVRHDKFGEGTIIKVSGSGSAKDADIAFPKLGIKTLTLKFAPVTVI